MSAPYDHSYGTGEQTMPADPRFGQGMLGQQNIQTPRKMTAMEAAQETFGAAHRLSDRVMALVNRIAGHVPQDPGKEGIASAVANGVLDEIRDGARSAHNAMLRANEALDRLERELP